MYSQQYFPFACCTALTNCNMSGCALQVIVVDEIGSTAEVAAVRGIAQRGIAMVGTAHGTDLSSLIANPDLNSLVGGIHQVPLGDVEAK